MNKGDLQVPTAKHKSYPIILSVSKILKKLSEGTEFPKQLFIT